MSAIASVIALSFFLSLDNFRLSIALGAYRFSWYRMLRTAVVFGLWDGVSPLIGLVIGHYIGQAVGPVANFVGPIVLAGFGLYLIARSLKSETPDEIEDAWALFGLPLSLSLDNLVAGTSLGMLGFTPVLPALSFGVTTAVMSFIGLQIGGAVARFIPLESDMLSGIGMLISASLFGLGYL